MCINTPETAVNFSQLNAQFVQTEVRTAKFDLNVAFAEMADRLRGTISYSTDLFDPETIERMGGHFEQLLQHMVADLTQPIATLPLLTEPEKVWLNAWNDTTQQFPACDSMVHLFEAQVDRVPLETAVIFEGQQYSYQELNQRANQLARQLQQMGIGKEQRVWLIA